MKLTKLVWNFSDFSMIFVNFARSLFFIEKEKNERKGKRLVWASSSPQLRQPNCKNLAQVGKRSPLEFGHFASGTDTGGQGWTKKN